MSPYQTLLLAAIEMVAGMTSADQVADVGAIGNLFAAINAYAPTLPPALPPVPQVVKK
jgi:hypothetical protein